MKELKCLVSPKVLLDPLGDRFKFVSADVKRGGEKYYKYLNFSRMKILFLLLIENVIFLFFQGRLGGLDTVWK